ncbi:class I SAM-dependent methyltransferase [uncultured Methanobrevibacter sp.]|jgi:ubiquinone/menaquinone biosynthesis C-methylase UbiE|uniref:class I SAM-dependent methyltransferase n=1 Tax=uncultured Methanobrevibacter sp. TaxID=253161 RepID=UPI0025D694FE|nr:class I SAM-dependent methyltransferase [uncultured Methanobrevibacter sp.]
MKEHVHHAKSSVKFFNSDEILKLLNFKGNEVFMDAGCGDGHIAITAVKNYLPDGMVYAVDNYEPAINELEEFISQKGIENLISVNADITRDIVQIEDDVIDIVLMINVVHGFKPAENIDEVIDNFLRILKDNGKFAVVDFNPIDLDVGPPLEIKYAPDELENIFNNHGFKKIYLNEELGMDSPKGKSHYLIIFEKE